MYVCYHTKTSDSKKCDNQPITNSKVHNQDQNFLEMKHPASIKSKLAILWSHLFPNVKDFIVTLMTTFFILYVLVQLKNNGNTGNKVNQQISSYKVKYPKIISKVEILQSSNFTYIWLLNKPYENEVILTGQNPNAASLLIFCMLL